MLVIMSAIQKQHDELRFIKRDKLKEESAVIGNYFRDVIRAYGVDAKYYKFISWYNLFCIPG